MHILVTGGCGFIGSHLVWALIEAGKTVTVLDDLSTGSRDALHPAAKLVVGDVAEPGIFDKLVERTDAIYHLAAIASVERSRTEWHRTHEVNAGGTINLFHAVAKSGKKIPVVYASSAAVYGDATLLPIVENSPIAPLSAYGADKYTCEIHGRVAASLHKIPNAAMRFFNVYGPGQDPKSPYSGVISIFMDKTRKGESLTIFGDGSQSRDFIFVGDVVKALCLAMDKLQSGAFMHQVFNIGTGNAISINELAQQILSFSRNTSPLIYAPSREGEILHSYCNNSHMVNTLGFTPAHRLSEGLRLTYEALP